MRIFFDNVDLNSSSGPNSFGRVLRDEFVRMGNEVSTTYDGQESQISFIHVTEKRSQKTVLRLDGIYFNTRQNWRSMNNPIEQSYRNSDVVVYQSHFNKKLIEKYFGTHERSIVIGNGTSLEEISKIEPVKHPVLDKFQKLWCCSSSWRPHKRLKSNVQYFLENRPVGTGLVVMGDNPDYVLNHPDIMYVGRQPWQTCISIYKRCERFIHLAYLDHCPNVVVDARASGCKIVVTSSGGTKEIAGVGAAVIEEEDWNMEPIDLYDPPKIDFTRAHENIIESSIDIKTVAEKYMRSFML